MPGDMGGGVSGTPHQTTTKKKKTNQKTLKQVNKKKPSKLAYKPTQSHF